MLRKLLLHFLSVIISVTLLFGNDDPLKEIARNRAASRRAASLPQPVAPLEQIAERKALRKADPPQKPKPTREIPPIDAICARKKIREAKVIIENIKSNSSAKEVIAKAKEEEVKQQEQKVREQNTLLGSYRDIGLYKKDLYQVPLLGAEIYADVLFYNELIKRRKKVICEKLIEDPRGLIEKLEQVNEKEKEWEKQLDEANAFGKALLNNENARNIFLHPLRQYVVENHVLFGFSPVNKLSLIPVLLRWLSQKGLDFARKKLIEKDRLMEDTPGDPMSISYSLFSAYKQKEDGTLERVEDPPISLSMIVTGAVGLIKFISNPGVSLLTSDSSAEDSPKKGLFSLESLNDRHNLHIPRFFFSSKGKLLIEYLTLSYVALYFDELTTDIWADFVCKNRIKLLGKLKAYVKALDVEGKEDDLIEAEAKLRKFVDKGHQPQGFMPTTLYGQWSRASVLGGLSFKYNSVRFLSYLLAVKGYMHEELPAPLRNMCLGYLGLGCCYEGSKGLASRMLPLWARATCAAGFMGILGYGLYSLYNLKKTYLG